MTRPTLIGCPPLNPVPCVLPNPDNLSLLTVCTDCHGRCCVGRTMVSSAERHQIVDLTTRDHFVHWADDLFYLERGTCPYLKNGLCSVQEFKPFVCQIFPFSPRVVDGELWLFCVGECEAASKLPPGFTERAIRLAQQFFRDRLPGDYAEYWNQNKLGDFDDEQVTVRVKVFDNERTARE
jgi:Fe-S-cluster containining protein